MNREPVYYSIIGGGLLLIVGIAIWKFWPEPVQPLDPPAVLTQKLESAPPEQKVTAAHDLIRHGPAARVEVRAALSQHQRYEPEVVAPLVQATMKNRDYRSIPTLFELVEHEDPVVRGRAGAALQKILGANFGFQANAPPEERRRVIEVMKSDYQQAMGRFNEVYGSQN